MARHEPEPTVLQTRHEHVLTCASSRQCGLLGTQRELLATA